MQIVGRYEDEDDEDSSDEDEEMEEDMEGRYDSQESFGDD